MGINVIGGRTASSSATAVKITATLRSTTTVLADPHLSLVVPSTGTWALSGRLYVNGPSGSPQIVITVATTATISSARWSYGSYTPSNTPAPQVGPDIALGSTSAITLDGSGNYRSTALQIDGYADVTAAGIIELRWASGSALGVMLYPGSSFQLAKIT